jgi:hypothetical protein
MSGTGGLLGAGDPENPRGKCLLLVACNDGRLRRIWAELERTKDGSLIATTKDRGSYHVRQEDALLVRYRRHLGRLGRGWLVIEGAVEGLALTGPAREPDAAALKAAVRSRIVREIWEAGVPVKRLMVMLLLACALAGLALVASLYAAHLLDQVMEDTARIAAQQAASSSAVEAALRALAAPRAAPSPFIPGGVGP